MKPPFHAQARRLVAATLSRGRWLAALLGLLLAGLCLAGAPGAELRNDFRAFVGENNPALEKTDRLADRLGESVESAALLFAPANGDVFADLSLLQYGQVADLAGRLPHVEETRSLFDADKLVAVRDAFGAITEVKAAPATWNTDFGDPTSLAALKADLAASPTLHGRWIGRSGAHAAVQLSLTLSERSEERLAQIRELRRGIEDIRAAVTAVQPNDRVLLVGTSLFDEASFQIFQEEVPTLMLAALFIVFAILWVIYGSLSFSAGAIIVIFLPVGAAAGAAAWLGIEMSVLSASGLLLVGTLAVADVAHLANAYFVERAGSPNAVEAIDRALDETFWPITATSLTTIAGQLALLLSTSPAVRAMGLVIILGVVLSWALCLLLMPLFLSWHSGVKPRAFELLATAMARLASLGVNRPAVSLGLALAITAAGAVGALQGEVRDSMNGWFGSETEFRQGLDLYDREFWGAGSVVLAVETSQVEISALRKHPEARPELAPFQELQRRLQGASGDAAWISPITAVEALRARLQTPPASTTLFADAASAAALEAPTSRSVIRSGLYTPFEAGRSNQTLWRTAPGAKSSFALVEDAAALEKISGDTLADRPAPYAAGMGLAFATISVSNFWNILYSSLGVLAIVTVCMVIALRSLSMGLLSMLPNLAPITLAYGVWGLNHGALNLAAVTMFAVALGIVVDDTLHTLMRYRRKRRAEEAASLTARSTIKDIGVGLTTTTVVICSGFGLLALLSFELTAQKALLAALAVAFALAFDVMLTPGIAVWWERWFGYGKRSVSTQRDWSR